MSEVSVAVTKHPGELTSKEERVYVDSWFQRSQSMSVSLLLFGIRMKKNGVEFGTCCIGTHI